MTDGPFRDSSVSIERFAELQAENEALRARLDALEAIARKDERHIQIKRLEKERDTLRERIGAWREQQEAAHASLVQENGTLRAELEERRAATDEKLAAELAAAKEENGKLRGEIAALKRRLDKSRDHAAFEALEAQLAEITRERDELTSHTRGENEEAYIRRLTEERDELLAEVRALRAKR